MILPKKPQILYAPMLATFGGGSSRGFGRGIGGGPELLLVDDVMVFTSAKMHGALGPNKAMTDAYYPYDSDIMGQFGAQVYNGYQKFTIPNDGTYRFNILGSWPINRSFLNYTAGLSGSPAYYTDSSLWTLFQQNNTHGSSSYSTYNGATAYAPGYLTVDRTLSKDDEIHVLVGQGAFSDSATGDPSTAGSGASAVFVGAQSDWNTNFAVAGSVGGARRNYFWNRSGISQVDYSTTAKRGGRGDDGTNAVTSVAGTNGSAGYDSAISAPITNGVSNLRSGGGAGLTGTARDNSYFDSRIPYFSLCAPTALNAGGMGGIGGGAYMNPTHSGDSSTYYMSMTFSNGVPSFASSQGTNFSNFETNWNNYANNSTDTMPTSAYPLGTHMGGFGGGCTGGWGGEGGAGGYSGGGPGQNNDYACGGSGSSYSSGFTNVSHTQATASTMLRNKTHIAPKIQGVTLSHLDRGFFSGNGSVTMTRIS